VDPDDVETIEQILTEALVWTIWSMSALVAATMRTSTFEGRGWPTGWISWFSISRSSLG
jgi:hypothetical protein